tara:strand:+ start:207 stop:845 length:639 start_codon:yes stop_codon:yes gene_type:complete
MINKDLQKRILSSLILIPVAFFFIIQGKVFFAFFLGLIFLVTIYEWSKMCKENYIMKFLGIIFLLFSFYSSFYIRENSDLYLFLFIILICIFTDVGGYVFGNIFKGPKLIKISPKKTYAGVLGGFLFSLIAGLSFMKIFGTNYLEIFNINIFFSILIISLISQIGDLIISFFKRKAKFKDTGNILPGHGGLLDRVDGLIFVMPLVYLKLFII